MPSVRGVKLKDAGISPNVQPLKLTEHLIADHRHEGRSKIRSFESEPINDQGSCLQPSSEASTTRLSKPAM